MIITLTNGGDTVCKGYFYRNLRKNDLPDIERGKLLAEVLDVSLDDLVNYDRKTAIILVWVFHQRESMFLESRKWERKVRL